MKIPASLRVFGLVGALLAGPLLEAAVTPELSADEPIQFSADSQVLTARGQALFTHEDVIITADVIEYHKRDNRIVAEGKVTITQAGLRLLSEKLEYNLETRRIRSGKFRAGYPPVFVEGESFEGTREQIDFSKAKAFYQEPEALSLRLKAESGYVRPRDKVHLQGASVSPFGGPGLPVPNLTRTFDAPSMSVETGLGYRTNFGAFVRSETLFPVTERLALGGNFDLYSKRGVLLGPSARYAFEEGDDFTFSSFSTGWIYDFGDDYRGTDSLGDDISPSRWFARFGHVQQTGNLALNVQGQVQSDSEMTRDFRRKVYETNPQPDNFAEVNYLWDDVLLTVFTRVNLSRDFGLTERLPEVRLDQAARRLGTSTLYHHWSAAVVSYRNTAIDPPQDQEITPLDHAWTAVGPDAVPQQPGVVIDRDYLEGELNQRADVLYALRNPIHLTNSLTLTPLATGRAAAYAESVDLPGVDNGGSTALAWGEVGVDLESRFHGQWDYRNSTWNVDGLRHILRPVAKYRLRGVDDGEAAALRPIDRALYSPALPVVDLADDRALDTPLDRHLLRFGLENLLQTRDEQQGSRDLFEANLYQDYVFDAAAGEDQAQGTYLQFHSRPARWLVFDYEQKVLTEDILNEDSRARVTFLSAEDWSLSLGSAYLRGNYEQYSTDIVYRILERWFLTAGLRYDAVIEELTRQRYGLRQRIGRAWEVEYFVSLREGTSREDDLSVGVRIELLSY